MSDALYAFQERAKRNREEFQRLFAELPKTSPCPKHPGQSRPIVDIKHQPITIPPRPEYEPCPLCIDESRRRADAERLVRAGVPDTLSGSTFENWEPTGSEERKVLASAREFVKGKRGFLILLGPVGTGKSHLAVASMLAFKRPMFIRQSMLLRMLRKSYRDRDLADPVDTCIAPDLLVLDELGLSAGGKDELPLLHDILDTRYGAYAPTVLTGNITVDELKDVLGERLFDRIRQAAFAIHTLAGKSHRPKVRNDYFAAERTVLKENPWEETL